MVKGITNKRFMQILSKGDKTMGKLVNSLVGLMNFVEDDEDEEGEDGTDEYEDFEHKGGWRSIFKRRDDGSDDPEGGEDDDPEEDPYYKASNRSRDNAKITPMRAAKRQGLDMELCVVKPVSMAEAREIAETLLKGQIVVLDVEGLDFELAQRIIDFSSGSCFAIGGNLEKVSSYIFIMSPKNVPISGDYINSKGTDEHNMQAIQTGM